MSEKAASRTSIESVVLLPCPLCGSSANSGRYVDDGGETWWIECSKCELLLGDRESFQDAMDAWNKRRSDGLRNWIKSELAKLRVNVDGRPIGQAERVYESAIKQAEKLLDSPVGQ